MAAQNNIKDLEELYYKLGAILQDQGNMPVNISVLQEDRKNPFGSFYDDRELATHMEVVASNGSKFLELYV